MRSTLRVVVSITQPARDERMNDWKSSMRKTIQQFAFALNPTTVAVCVPPISREQRAEIARHVKTLG